MLEPACHPRGKREVGSYFTEVNRSGNFQHWRDDSGGREIGLILFYYYFFLDKGGVLP
jgi:hypothetical protein